MSTATPNKVVPVTVESNGVLASILFYHYDIKWISLLQAGQAEFRVY